MREKKVLGLFRIVMINIIAVDSIRTLPFAAEYGFSLIFYYLVMGIGFMCTLSLFAAELSTAIPETGGLYIWIREAFGKKASLVGVWLYWIYNVVWYPTILALIAGTCAYFFDPNLAKNPVYMGIMVVSIYWIMTWLNMRGMKLSSTVSVITSILGVMFPMAIIIILLFVWISMGDTIHISMSWKAIIPKFSETRNLAFLSSLLFGLLGLEMTAIHVREMKKPKRDYPIALLISVIVILGTLILSSLAIAVVVPVKEMSLITGVIQAFSHFFIKFNIPLLIPIFAACIVIGALGTVGAWIIGPPKGLMVASEDGLLPKYLSATNKHGVPSHMLLMQAIVVSIISIIYVVIPDVNTSFWILSAITAQLAILPYLLIFFSGIRLRYTKPNLSRPFRIPGGAWGIWIVGGLGIVTALFAFCCGFIPPPTIKESSIIAYEFWLIGGMVVLCLFPFLFYLKRR
jgi:glutamate:GABA antiporter